MTLAQFQRSEEKDSSSASSPLQELRASPDKSGTARVLLSPARIQNTFPAGPCLVWTVCFRRNPEQPKYEVLPCGIFERKKIQVSTFSHREKELTLPVHPNSNDFLNRPSVKTEPIWCTNKGYQVLSPVNVNITVVTSGLRIPTRLQRGERQRLLDIMAKMQQEQQARGSSSQTDYPVIFPSLNPPVNIRPEANDPTLEGSLDPLFNLLYLETADGADFSSPGSFVEDLGPGNHTIAEDFRRDFLWRNVALGVAAHSRLRETKTFRISCSTGKRCTTQESRRNSGWWIQRSSGSEAEMLMWLKKSNVFANYLANDPSKKLRMILIVVPRLFPNFSIQRYVDNGHKDTILGEFKLPWIEQWVWDFGSRIVQSSSISTTSEASSSRKRSASLMQLYQLGENKRESTISKSLAYRIWQRRCE